MNMKFLFFDGYIAAKIREITFDSQVELGNLVLPEEVEGTHVIIGESTAPLEYTSDSANARVTQQIFVFSKSFDSLLATSEQVALKLQDCTGEFDGVSVEKFKLVNIVKDWNAGVYGMILTFEILLVDDF